MATSEMLRSVTVISEIPGLIPALRTMLPKINFHQINKDSITDIELEKCEILISDNKLISPYLYRLPKVKWVQLTWAGVETLMHHIDRTKPALPYPLLRYSGPSFGKIMSEYVIAQLVAHQRDFYKIWEQQQRKEWNIEGNIHNYKIIADSTIGILGVGVIGLYIAKVLKVLGATIWGLVKDIPEIKSEFIDEYRTTKGLEDLLRNCNIVVNVLPSTPETIGLLNAQKLKSAKGIVLINIGRGSIIEESEIMKALDEGAISMAILDVFSSEPLPMDSSLWSHPKVKITPHVAGVTRGFDVAKTFAENLSNWYDGKPFVSRIVNLDKGY